jgi:hypothetical protein
MDLYILCPKHRKTRPKQSILTTSKGFSDAFDHLTCQAGSTWQWDTFFFSCRNWLHSNLEGGGVLEPTSELSATSQKYVKKKVMEPPKKWD